MGNRPHQVFFKLPHGWPIKWAQQETLFPHIQMTLFFTVVALVHFTGLFAMLLAIRRAPVAVENNSGFMVIAQPAEAREALGALVRTA